MSLKKIEQVKTDKGFKIWDILIYALIAITVVALFISVFATRDKSPLKGIRVVVVNDTVFEYDFESGEQNVLDSSRVEIAEETSDSLKIIIKPNKDEYNTVLINKSGSVKITEANCRRRDCVYTSEIKDNSGVIFCLSHAVKIEPYDVQLDPPDIIM